MKLYITYTSPYARLARILVLERAAEASASKSSRRKRARWIARIIELIFLAASPTSIDDSGIGMEDSRLICSYLDNLDGKPRFHQPLRDLDWAYRRLEATARGFCDWHCRLDLRINWPEDERSPSLLAHEVARAGRLADVFEAEVKRPLLQGATRHGSLASRGVTGSGARARFGRSNEYAPGARGLAAAYFRDVLAARDGAAVHCLVNAHSGRRITLTQRDVVDAAMWFARFRHPALRLWRHLFGHGAMSDSESASLIGRFGVKRFQTIHHCSVDVARGLVLLFGIGTRALPSWDSRTRRNNLLVGLAVSRTAGPSGHTNSPHPSSREGHLSTARWSSSFLLSGLILNGFHAAAAACSRVHRNSVPSTQMRCMITASRRARATIAFFIPRRLAICMAHALSQDHFFECIML